MDTLKRRNVGIACLQETKWKGNKAREIAGYKLWYCGLDNMRNGVDIIVEPKLKDKVVEVKRKRDKIILLRLVLGDVTINVISAYALQVGLNGATKDKF